MVNYHDEVVALLAQNRCQRLDSLGDGIFKWHSSKTDVTFNVDLDIPSKIAANEILARAGIAKILKDPIRR